MLGLRHFEQQPFGKFENRLECSRGALSATDIETTFRTLTDFAGAFEFRGNTPAQELEGFRFDHGRETAAVDTVQPFAADDVGLHFRIAASRRP